MTNLSDWVARLAQDAVFWQRSTYMCSAPSHTYLYVLIAGWIVIAAGGVYAWHRFIKTKPVQLAE